MTNLFIPSLPTRRSLLLGLAAMGAMSVAGAATSASVAMQVWKDPSCGCCKDWVATLEKSGFRVAVIEQGNTATRSRLGMPAQFGSCHTAVVQGYVIEGHVPATDILRLLKEHPNALGLAVPGMPIGSPGMDGPGYGERRDPFRVLLIQKDGSAQTFSSYS